MSRLCNVNIVQACATPETKSVIQLFRRNNYDYDTLTPQSVKQNDADFSMPAVVIICLILFIQLDCNSELSKKYSSGLFCVCSLH